MSDAYVKKFGIAFQVDRLTLQRAKSSDLDELVRRQKAAAMAKAEMMIDAEVRGSDWHIRYGPWEYHDPRDATDRRRTADEFAPVEYRRYLYLYRG